MPRKKTFRLVSAIVVMLLMTGAGSSVLAQSEPHPGPAVGSNTIYLPLAAGDSQTEEQTPEAPTPEPPLGPELPRPEEGNQLPVGPTPGPILGPELPDSNSVRTPNAFDVPNWNVAGRIGIGTDAPKHLLSINGGPAWTPSFWAGAIELNNGAAIGWKTNSASNRFGIGHTNGGLYMFRTTSDPGTTAGVNTWDLTITDQGNVGIGNPSPKHRLSISGGPAWTSSFWTGAMALTNGSAIAWQGNAAGRRFGIGHTNGGLFFFRTLGDLGTSTETALYDLRIDDIGRVIVERSMQVKSSLSVANTTTTKVLRITGGADIAEPFEIANTKALRPGMVVAIDPEHAGKLRIADHPYDRTVAGVISGAGGVKTGLLMHQEGVLGAEDQQAVALSGRVYVWADASYGAIQPGDMLTTSATPGHAMRVTDYGRAHGTVLGKAMTGLETGKDLILMLVSLQ